MTTKLHIWNLSPEAAKDLTPAAVQTLLNEAASQFHTQESRTSGIADGIMRVLQCVTLSEGREALKKAEAHYKDKHDTKRMPGSWRTIKATCLAVKEERESEFNSAESYHTIKGLYKEVTKGRRDAKAAEVRAAADKAATMTDEELDGMSPQDLLNATNHARRDILNRVGELPNAYQLKFWQSDALADLVRDFEQQFEAAKAAIEGAQEASGEPQAVAAG